MTPLLVLTALIHAQVYTWTDKEGVEHFTDDATAIPKGVKARKTEGTELGRVETGPSQPAQATVIPVAPTPVIITQAAAPDVEEMWRKRFRDARNKVTSLEEEIEADRKQVEEVNGMPVNARFNCQTYLPPPYYAPGFVGPGFVTSSTGLSVGVGGQLAPGLSVSGSAVTTTTGTAVVQPFPLMVAPCGFGFNPDFDRVKQRLESNRRELVRAKAELDELDRRASFEAVPRHWRR